VALSLRTKIAFIVVAILFSAVLAHTALSSYVFSKEYSSVLQSKMVVVGKNLRFQLERLLKLGIPIENLVGFEEQCRDIVEGYENVSYAMVVDINGRILFHSDPGEHGKTVDDPATLKAIEGATDVVQAYRKDGDGYYDIVIPVFYPPDVHVAAVRIGFPAKFIAQKTAGLVAYSILVSAVFLALAITLMIFAMSVLVTKPIGQLLGVIRDIRKGGTAFMKKVELRTGDEIGQLGSAFNMMLGDLKKFHEEIIESEDKFRTLTSRASDAIVLIDHEGLISFWNEAAEKMFGYARHEVMGSELLSLIVTPKYMDAFVELFGKFRNGERDLRHVVGKPLEVPAVRKDGTVLLVELSFSAIQLKGRWNAAGIIRDITERKKTEEEMSKAQRLESLGVLAGGLAHDFNNLLTGILGNISLIKMYGDFPDKTRKRLEEAEKASMRARELTQQLLTFSKGGAPIKKTLSIGELVRESAGFALRGSNVKCKYRIPDDLWPAEVDEGQISQVLNNLVINAVQSMPQGGTVLVGCENVAISGADALPLKEGDYIKISIKDQGIGIPDEHLQRIFDPYFTTKQTGSGLGLAMVYSIVKRHDGHVAVESEMGYGTIFHVYLPASREEAVRKKVFEGEPIPGRGKVLLVDDEEMVRSAAAEMLTHIGYYVEQARDGNEAMELYKINLDSGHPFDTVIMDLTIPGGTLL
jgi:PAS domain S-box-containing protein